MKGLKFLLLGLVFSLLLTGCNSSEETGNGKDDKKEENNSIINKSDYTNPLICKKVTSSENNTITEYLIYDYDKEGTNVKAYAEINTYTYKENQSSENKDRYAKWYDCTNFSNNTRIDKCSSSWVSDKEYKITKTFTAEVVSNLEGISFSELKSQPKSGFECE